MTDTNYTRTCEHCGKEFAAKTRLTRFCSNSCKDKNRSLVPSINAVCNGCGKLFIAKRKCRSSYCSRKCQAKFAAIHRKETTWLRKDWNKTLYTIAVLIEIAALRRIKNLNKKTNGSIGKKRSLLCKQCGQKFVYTIQKSAPPKFCSDKCRKSSNEPNRKKHSRIAKSRRRAIERSLYADRFDPLDIFARDKWHCHICGCKTPKKKRGTYDDNAPELDHIVPLSKGGQHTRSNVACSCRKCNQLKSDKPLGQLNFGII